MEKIDLDRSNWELVTFGDVAIQQKEKIDRGGTGLTRYIKGEHMSSDDLHIREWGELADEYLGPAFIRKFEKGDILYGSRRTYLRKVAIADFDGITSNTTFVIKANESKILSSLLPFVMMSEGFTEHSIKNSKGSVNPYVNWKDIANYEFLLPPKEQQPQLAELLWAMDVLIEKDQQVLHQSKIILLSSVKENCLNVDGVITTLSKIIDKLESGVSVNSEEGHVNIADKGILKTSAVSSGIFNSAEVKKVVSNEHVRLKAKVRNNSIVISRMNTMELVGANAYVNADYPNLYLPDRLWQTCISRADINIKFLWFVLSSPTYRKRISNLCSGTSNSMKNISQPSFLGLKMVVPSKAVQDNVVAELAFLERSIEAMERKISNTKILHKFLINQVF